MKKTKFIIAVSAILTFMASVPAFAQEENGFKKFNVREDSDPQYFKSDAPNRMYARSAEGRSQGENFPAGIHSMYIGEVVNAWKK